MMKSNARVVAVFLLIVAGLILLFWLLDKQPAPETEAVQDEAAAETPAKNGQEHFSDYLPQQHHLVQFDPNTADSTTLLSLGLPEYMVRGIYKYRSKGGVYSTPEDFARVPGLTLGQFRELRPYIVIGEDFRPAADYVEPRRHTAASHRSDTTVYPVKLTAEERISLNDADTNLLKRVPGIGSYYARRIVELRERYGGFTSLNQLLDINGLPQESLQYLSILDDEVRKINLNTADFTTLRSHPYIGYARAKAICDYRRLKGRITSLKQLSLMQGFSKSERSRLEPYVDF